MDGPCPLRGVQAVPRVQERLRLRLPAPVKQPHPAEGPPPPRRLHRRQQAQSPRPHRPCGEEEPRRRFVPAPAFLAGGITQEKCLHPRPGSPADEGGRKEGSRPLCQAAEARPRCPRPPHLEGDPDHGRAGPEQSGKSRRRPRKQAHLRQTAPCSPRPGRQQNPPGGGVEPQAASHQEQQDPVHQQIHRKQHIYVYSISHSNRLTSGTHGLL